MLFIFFKLLILFSFFRFRFFFFAFSLFYLLSGSLRKKEAEKLCHKKQRQRHNENNNKALETNVFSKFNISCFVKIISERLPNKMWRERRRLPISLSLSFSPSHTFRGSAKSFAVRFVRLQVGNILCCLLLLYLLAMQACMRVFGCVCVCAGIFTNSIAYFSACVAVVC